MASQNDRCRFPKLSVFQLKPSHFCSKIKQNILNENDQYSTITRPIFDIRLKKIYLKRTVQRAEKGSHSVQNDGLGSEKRSDYLGHDS